MKRVDVQRIRIRIEGSPAGWSGDAAARLGASILSGLAGQLAVAGRAGEGATRVLARVEAGTIRSSGGGAGAPGLAGQVTEAVVRAASRGGAEG